MQMTRILFVAACFITLEYVQGLAVMSVDLGSEWMKIGIVSPGVPMEIALNKESKRKTPAVISFRDNVRYFGEDAQTVGIRFPKNAYIYLLDLLGKDINHPLVKLYQKRFPYYDIVEDAERKTILFKHDENTYYSPEELIAQLFVKAKEFAEQAARQPIKECVITVPGYFNQVERKSLFQAAKLADLKVLQLINDYTAVALNYGIFRSKDFNESSQYVMFYDMGSSSTTATVVSYQMVKTKERGYVETHPEVSIIGVGYDRTLGGLEMQIRLRDHLATEFNKIKKTKTNVFTDPRAMAKLFKEAGRVKNVLSANAEHYAQIEGLLEEEDFKLLVTRNDLEELVLDLFERVGKPIEQALKTAQLTKDILNQVVLFGAGTRAPKIKDILQNLLGQEVAKNLNTDEAAVMGAVYKAADLSTGFQVKKFITKDAIVFPIQVTFERESDSKLKQVKRTLFGLMNPYPQKKIITFNKHTSDFSFNVNYGDLDHLSAEEIINVGALNLSEIQLTEVSSAFQKHSGDNIETKGIKSHFQMDESGILNLVNVELVVEKTITEHEEEGTLSKLGSTISKLFGGDEKLTDEKPVHEEPEQELPDNKTEPEPKEKPTVNGTSEKNNTLKSTQEVKPKIITLKELIKSRETTFSIQTLNDDQFSKSQKKIHHLNEIENEINRRATALNNLESLVFDVQNKLSEEEYSEATTEEEKTKILSLCSSVSDWLYEDGAEADVDKYENKLEKLKSETQELFSRVWEHNERPEAINALHSILNHSSHFLNSAKNFTVEVNPDKDIFSEKEVAALEKLIEDTKNWEVKMVEGQNKLKKYEPVLLTVKSITDKMGALDREVKYLVNKLRLWKPKKTETLKEKEEIIAEEPTSEDKPSNDTNSSKKIESKERTTETQANNESSTVETDDKKSDQAHSEL